jgi:CBS domain-containing protein
VKTGDIMNRTPVSVRSDQTFGDAFQTLVKSRMTNLPAVDAEGIFQGNFDLKDVWNVLLPKAAQLDRKSIEDLSFVSTSLDKLKDLVADVSALPVSKFLNTQDAPPLHPENPVIQAILLLDEHGETLAVVDSKTRKLVGTVSPWDVLDPIVSPGD